MNELFQFHTAIMNGEVDKVQRLLAANPSLANEHILKDTPLTLSARKSRLSICEALVAAGADVNEPGDDGYSPLGNAAVYYMRSGAEDLKVVIEFLISKGAKIDRPQYMLMITKGDEMQMEREVDAVQQQRRAQDLCILCGKSLGFFDKIGGSGKHKGCTVFQK